MFLRAKRLPAFGSERRARLPAWEDAAIFMLFSSEKGRFAAHIRVEKNVEIFGVFNLGVTLGIFRGLTFHLFLGNLSRMFFRVIRVPTSGTERRARPPARGIAAICPLFAREMERFTTHVRGGNPWKTFTRPAGPAFLKNFARQPRAGFRFDQQKKHARFFRPCRAAFQTTTQQGGRMNRST